MVKITSSVILKAPSFRDDFFGGISRTTNDKILIPGGQWDLYAPSDEWQIGTWVATQACTDFSAANNIEFILDEWVANIRYRLTNNIYVAHEEQGALDFLTVGGYFDDNSKVNISDRFLAYVSGTTMAGNSVNAVADAMRHYGIVPERDWGFDISKEGKVTWDVYYTNPPQWLYDKGLKSLEIFEFAYEWVAQSLENIKDALQYAPLQCIIDYYDREDKAGIVHPYTGTGALSKHAVTIYGYDDGNYLKEFDSISKINKKLSWDYIIYAALKYNITLKNTNPMLKLKNDCLVQMIGHGAKTGREGNGEFAIYTAGKLYVGDQGAIERTWLMRSNDFTNKHPVNPDDWFSIPHYNVQKVEQLIFQPQK